MDEQQLNEQLEYWEAQIRRSSEPRATEHWPVIYHSILPVYRGVQLQCLLMTDGTATPARRRTAERIFRSAVESVRVLMEVDQAGPEVISCAAELTILVGSGSMGRLKALLPAQLSGAIAEKGTIKPDTYRIFRNAISACLVEDHPRLACIIAENLAALSSRRNGYLSDRHRFLVQKMMEAIVDTDRTCAARIGDRFRASFDNADTKDSALFFWYYGFAMDNADRRRESMACFRRVREIMGKLGLENRWLCGRAECSWNLSRMMLDDSDEAEAQLWALLARLKDGYYVGVDPSAPLQAALTIYHLVHRQYIRGECGDLLPCLEWLLAFCSEHEGKLTDPRLCRRNAHTLLAVYYERTGAYLQAVQHCWEALDAGVPEGVVPLITDAAVYSNLMNFYTIMSDFDAMQQLGDIIIRKLDELAAEDEEHPDGFFRLLAVHFHSLYRAGYRFEDAMDDLREDLMEVYGCLDDLTEPDWLDDLDERLSFFLLVYGKIQCVMDTHNASPEEMVCYREILQTFLDNPQLYPLIPRQQIALLIELTRLQWRLGAGNVFESLSHLLKMCAQLSSDDEAYIVAMRFAAAVCYCLGRSDQAMTLIRRTLSGATAAWHKAVACLNDRRINQLLFYDAVQLEVCYRILHLMAGPEELYEYVLRSKDLPSLVSRERNRLMRCRQVDEALRDRIYRLQDQIAAARQSDLLTGTDTATPLERQLVRLEADFAEQFPEQLQFTPISYAALARKLPEDAAVIEYAFCMELTNEITAPAMLDIFVMVKKNGRIRFHHLAREGAEEIRENAKTYIGMLQDPDQSVTDDLTRTRLADNLYRTLVAPAMEYVTEVRTLYLAPDQELCNLPFEILGSEDGGMLQDRFRICRLVCGRDLLFDPVDRGTSPRRFVLGAPDYEAEIGSLHPSRDRGGDPSLKPFPPLPFSGLEAERIGRRCHCESVTGSAATKYAFFNALPCGIIHLATHGVFDPGYHMDQIYGAYLIFSGYNQWLSNKTESEGCGNGILTADEISRADLHETELVVLSACNSGMGSSSFATVRGLVSAFSATGVRWVVSHLWKANDFATAVLMDAFYKAHLTMHMDVPEALDWARRYLRDMTVGQLRREGWLDTDRNRDLDEDTRAHLQWWARANDRRKPFAHERYWGGFVCHKCN